jgi:hypothetical protein
MATISNPPDHGQPAKLSACHRSWRAPTDPVVTAALTAMATESGPPGIGAGQFLPAWNVLYRTVLPKPKGDHPVPEANSGGTLMTQQDRWWLAISIGWLFLTLGMLLYLGFA